ncbi:hypothetical protein LTR84_004933 [Exophiala bonariae]|uniref:Uncharacterized protein n=1 Tax=Exophiala bonariae TaxID=1690606 RepID=A0AAV9NNV8_9EURO|nr:hypothetical protein LTR84_004933 [Exophiala bonariae]
MPKEEQKTTFIVTTSSAHGAWYPEKKSTLSLINSHVANRKAQQASQRRAQSSRSVRQARPRKHPSVDTNGPSLIGEGESQSEAEPLSNAQPNERPGWSLEELEDIFGEQNKTEAAPQNSTAKIQYGQRLTIRPNASDIENPPTLSRASSYQIIQAQQNTRLHQSINEDSKLKPVIWDHAARTHESVSRLPHRAAAQRQLNRDPQETVSIGDPSHQPIAAYTSAPPTILKQVESILDPFLRLSIKVSTFEQQLLHFYLTEGRQVLYGTSANPAYCPALHLASRGLLQRSPAYVETHIAMAEHILCGLRSEQVTANFFRRRADAYKTVGDLVLNPGAEFDDQLCGLICLQTAEHTIGRTDLQAVHLKAMHELVERRGGIQFFLRAQRPESALTEPVEYSNQYMFAKIDVQGNNDLLARAKDDVLGNLRRIRLWTLRIQGLHIDATPSAGLELQERRAYQSTLTTIKSYMSTIISKYLRKDNTPYHQAASTFNLLFTLCTTLVAYDLGPDPTSQFLLSIQTMMENSTDKQSTKETFGGAEEHSELSGLHPCTIVCLVSQLRKNLTKQTRSQTPNSPSLTSYNTIDSFTLEVFLSSSSIGAMTLFPFLEFGTRLRLCRGLLRSALSVCDMTMGETFGEAELQDLDLEISRAYQ